MAFKETMTTLFSNKAEETVVLSKDDKKEIIADTFKKFKLIDAVTIPGSTERLAMWKMFRLLTKLENHYEYGLNIMED